jgi:hypothetical protein
MTESHGWNTSAVGYRLVGESAFTTAQCNRISTFCLVTLGPGTSNQSHTPPTRLQAALVVTDAAGKWIADKRGQIFTNYDSVSHTFAETIDITDLPPGVYKAGFYMYLEEGEGSIEFPLWDWWEVGIDHDMDGIAQISWTAISQDGIE